MVRSMIGARSTGDRPADSVDEIDGTGTTDRMRLGLQQTENASAGGLCSEMPIHGKNNCQSKLESCRHHSNRVFLLIDDSRDDHNYNQYACDDQYALRRNFVLLLVFRSQSFGE